MYTTRFVLSAITALCAVLTPFSKAAMAIDTLDNETLRPIINTHEWKPVEAPMKFTITPVKEKTKPSLYIPSSKNAAPAQVERQNKFASRSMEDRNWEDEILEKIPHGERLKYMWNVVDGDVDLHFTGLRFDRGNTGVSYKTNYVPFIGEMDTVQFRFDAGEENEISFKTSHVPFAGDLQGLNFKASTGDSGSKISARYTIALD